MHCRDFPVFDERDVRAGLGRGCGHKAMIPLRHRNIYQIMTTYCAGQVGP
jgi:hypothetical protein